MIYSIEHIIKAVKLTRQKKGLSQRELGMKVGLPQSHISRIERGEVDIQTSSLLEISRVLDLELMLVPRSLVPTVEGLQRGVQEREDSSSQSIVKELEKLRRSTQQVERYFSENEDIKRLASILKNLEQFRISNSQAIQIKKLIEQSKPPLESIKDMQKAQDTLKQAINNSQLLEQLNRLNQTTRAFENLRNAVVGAMQNVLDPVPAYSLNEDNDEA